MLWHDAFFFFFLMPFLMTSLLTVDSQHLTQCLAQIRYLITTCGEMMGAKIEHGKYYGSTSERIMKALWRHQEAVTCELPFEG